MGEGRAKGGGADTRGRGDRPPSPCTSSPTHILWWQEMNFTERKSESGRFWGHQRLGSRPPPLSLGGGEGRKSTQNTLPWGLGRPERGLSPGQCNTRFNVCLQYPTSCVSGGGMRWWGALLSRGSPPSAGLHSLWGVKTVGRQGLSRGLSTGGRGGGWTLWRRTVTEGSGGSIQAYGGASEVVPCQAVTQKLQILGDGTL